MRAIVIERFGEPAEVLRLQEVPVPQPKRGEVRVRMLMSPVNPSDLMTVRGVYGKLPKLPAVPGFEGVGVVEAAGGGLLGKWLVGKRVAVLNGITGNWQEQTVVPAKQAVPISQEIPTDQAAAFFVNPATAYVMTREVLAVPRGEWLLQTAAGSTLGRMVIRLGKRFGFRTLNIVRRQEQADELLAAGADAAIAPPPEELADQVRDITGGNGVRFAIDPVGGETASAVVRCLAVGGRMLVYGTLSGEPMRFSPRDLMTPSASVEGFWLARYMLSLSLVKKISLIKKVDKLIREGTLHSEIGSTYSLDQIADAVREAEKPARGGKVLLDIQGEK